MPSIADRDPGKAVPRGDRRLDPRPGSVDLHADWAVPALWIFLLSYLVLAGITWSVYLRSRLAKEMRTRPGGSPNLAGAAT